MTRNLYSAALTRSATPFARFAACAALAVASAFASAQIPQPSGPAQPDSRASAMGSTPEPAASAVHESHKPQSKDSPGSAKTRGKTGGKNQKAEGAGGFDNGLYGTGAGSNK